MKPRASDRLASVFTACVSRRAALGRLGGMAAGLTAGVGQAVTAESAVSAPSAAAADPQTHDIVLTADEIDWEILPGTIVRAWAYNGPVPGPELRVTEGDTVRVTLRNALPVPTTIHWHGVNLPPAMDGPAGLNQAPVEPGEAFVYEFIATPPAPAGTTPTPTRRLQVPLGLYGP